MISDKVMRRALGRLSLLKYFPAAPEALVVLAEILGEKCANDEQLTAVVARLLSDFDEWPGPRSFQESVSYASRIGVQSSEGVDPYAIWVPARKDIA